jgi:DNA-binding response OmpR family regulator
MVRTATKRGKHTVLVVEDDPALQRLMSQHLVRMNVDVLVASHYAAALAHFASRTPDLACVDVGLPTESGFDLCEYIRGPLGLKLMPIVVMGECGRPADAAYAEEAGANAFLAKPFSMPELSANIVALLHGISPRTARATRWLEGEVMASTLILANARRDVRHAVDLPCTVVREKNLTLVSLRAVDLSPDGMRVELRNVEVEVGDRLFVSFQIAALGKWLYTDAFATRLLRGRRPGETSPSLVVLFGSLPAASRLCVRDSLRKVPPHLPQRQQRVDYAATVDRILAG